MKTTIDIPEDIYRKVKAKSALEGRPVRDVVTTLFSAWVERRDMPSERVETNMKKTDNQSLPPWFASLRKYAHNAKGRYGMDAVRQSIAKGRAIRERLS